MKIIYLKCSLIYCVRTFVNKSWEGFVEPFDGFCEKRITIAFTQNSTSVNMGEIKYSTKVSTNIFMPIHSCKLS